MKNSDLADLARNIAEKAYALILILESVQH